MQMFRNMPVMACVRDPRGKVLDITDRLVAQVGKTRRRVIGRHITAVWGKRAQRWHELDQLALQQRKPLVRLERCESGLWLHSTRLVSRGLVVWFAEDATAQVRLSGAKVLLRLIAGGGAVPSMFSVDQEVAEALLERPNTEAELRTALGIEQGEALESITRLLRG